MTAADLTAIYDELKADIGNDTLRRIYADALEDSGDDEGAAIQRAIAGLGLGLHLLTDEDRREAQANYFDHETGFEDTEDVDFEEWCERHPVCAAFDEDLLVAYYSVGDENHEWVANSSRGDLEMFQLRGRVRNAIAGTMEDE